MITVGYKISDQPWLFPKDFKFKSFAETRNVVGDFFEDLTASLTGSRRCKTDGTKDYCPDIHHEGNTFFECKSVGKNGTVIVYRDRLEKDLKFVADGHNLYYFMWKHSVKCKQVGGFVELCESLKLSLSKIVVLDVQSLSVVAKEKECRVLNKSYDQRNNPLGYGNRSKGYGVGWCISLSRLESVCDEVGEVDFEGRKVVLKGKKDGIQTKVFKTACEVAQAQGIA